jgi:hypothetical protein
MQESTAAEKVEYMIKAMESFLEFNKKESLSDEKAHEACNIMFSEFLIDNLTQESESIRITQKQTSQGTIASLGFYKPDGEKVDEKDKKPITWLKPHVLEA